MSRLTAFVLLALCVAALAPRSYALRKTSREPSSAEKGSGILLPPAAATPSSTTSQAANPASNSNLSSDSTDETPPMDPADAVNDATAQATSGSDDGQEADDSDKDAESSKGDDSIGKNMFKGKITVVKNDNFLVSNLKMEEDESLKQEQRVKRVEMQRERVRAAEEKLRRMDVEDQERKKREEAAEDAGKKSREQELAEQRKREEDAKEKAEEEKRKGLYKAQQEVLKQRAQAQKEAAQRAAQEAKERQKTACRRKQASPSQNAGQFDWPVFRYDLGPYPAYDNEWAFNSRATLVGDFNGDGKTDYARAGRTYIRFLISKGDGTFFQPVYPFPSGWDFGTDENSWTTLKTLDLNGDKRADIIRTHHNYNHGFISKGDDKQCFLRDGEMDASCFTVTTFRYPQNWQFTGVWSFNHPAAVQGDFNGDGKGDFARLGATYIHFFISKGDGQFFTPIYYFNDGWNFGWNEDGWTSAVGDYNADCKTDIVRTSSRYQHGFYSTDTENCWQRNDRMPKECFKVTTFWYPNGWNFVGSWSWVSRAFIQGDFNGDSRTDMARLGGQYIHFFISQGNGQYAYPIYPFPSGWDFGFNEDVWTSLPPADFDGDGKDDIIRTYFTYNHGFYSRGNDADCWSKNGWIARECMLVTAFRYPGGWHFSGGWSWNSLATIVADFNGDGKADYGNLRGSTYNHLFFAK